MLNLLPVQNTQKYNTSLIPYTYRLCTSVPVQKTPYKGGFALTKCNVVQKHWFKK